MVTCCLHNNKIGTKNHQQKTTLKSHRSKMQVLEMLLNIILHIINKLSISSPTKMKIYIY